MRIPVRKDPFSTVPHGTNPMPTILCPEKGKRTPDSRQTSDCLRTVHHTVFAAESPDLPPRPISSASHALFIPHFISRIRTLIPTRSALCHTFLPPRAAFLRPPTQKKSPSPNGDRDIETDLKGRTSERHTPQTIRIIST